MFKKYIPQILLTFVFILGSSGTHALTKCKDLPSAAELQQALVGARMANNGGFNLDMWASIVNRDGEVCAVVFTGDDRGQQWPGSRVISAQKASTANAFSLPGLALSTANLWQPTQPGGSLFGLQFSNPVDTAVAYGNVSSKHGDKKGDRYGQGSKDPMVGSIIGGVNVFGGGLAIYNSEGTLLGAIGVSGDSSCADHNIAWRTRDGLGLDHVPGGVSPVGDDNIILDPLEAFGHPVCTGPGNVADNEAVVMACPIGDGPTIGCI